MKKPIKFTVDKQTQLILKTFSKISEGMILSPSGASIKNAGGYAGAVWTGFKCPVRFPLSNINKFNKLFGSLGNNEASMVWEDDEDETDGGKYTTIQVTNGDEQVILQEGCEEIIFEFDVDDQADYADDTMDYFFEISAEQIKKIDYFSKLLKIKDLKFSFTGTEVNIVIKDTDFESDSYDFAIELNKEVDMDFDIILDISEIEFYPSDYRVGVGSDGFAKFTSTEFEDDETDEEPPILCYYLSSKDI